MRPLGGDRLDRATAAHPPRHTPSRRGAGRALAPGDLLVLEGDLGAGKTFLVRGIARALGVPSRAAGHQPHVYAGERARARSLPLVHADLYRLGDADELVELGLVERIGAMPS